MKMTFSVLIVLAALMLSCKKSSVNTPPTNNTDSTITLYMGGTLKKMLVIDESTDKRRFIELEEGGGPVYRHQINKTYSFAYIGATFNCKWEIENASNAVFPVGTNVSTLNNEVVMMHSKDKPDYWLDVVKGGTINGDEEWYLWSGYVSANRPSSDQYKFKLHQVDDQNGVHAYTIESILKPGYYLYNSGNNITANGVVLVNHKVSPLQKTIFEMR